MSSHDDRGLAARHKSATGRHGPEVLIVGPYPPPLGGVSSHVQRATLALRNAGYTVGVLNHFTSEIDNSPVVGTLRRNPVLYFLKLRKAHGPVVHYHHAGRLSLLLAAALARPKRDGRWLVTIHNHSLTRSLESSRSSRGLVRWALGRFDQIVAVSPEIGKFLEDHGISTPIMVVPAYVPSRVRRATVFADWAPTTFFERPGQTLVVAAYRVRCLHKRGDIYGLDVAARTFAALAGERADLKLAIFLSHPPRGRRARRYLRSVLDLIAPELHGRVGVWIGERLSPAFGPHVIYLRPTRTDGDSVSVREALESGVPVIASDCTARPHGVTTARLGDEHTWREILRTMLAGLDDQEALGTEAAFPTSESTEAGGQDVLGLYELHL
jgi:glycosyltransferase involved in cell wall biosynthesis